MTARGQLNSRNLLSKWGGNVLVLHNLKKSKGQYISFGIIICITALILNIALVLSNQMSGAYDRRFEELNTAELNVMIPKMMSSDELAEELSALSGVEKTEQYEGVFVTATVREFQGSDFDINSVFYNLDDARTLNRLEFTYGDKDAVYLPAYLTQLGGFEIGGSITYAIDGEDYSQKIGGAVSEMQYGNYGTGFIGAYPPEGLYRDLASNTSGKTEIAEYSLKTSKSADLAAIKRDISKLLSDKGIPALAVLDRESGKQARTMACDLLIAIFLALAAIILAVSLFLSNFKGRNTIDEEMTEMGVLKGLGYTSAMIIAGAALSYLVLPLAADILGVQSGFSFTPAFDLPALILTIAIPTAAIALFSYLAARKIRRLEPINAIRGITGASSGKNRFPPETAGTPPKFTLILKQIASSAGQNILLFAVSFGIMVLMSFAGALVYNVNMKPDNFMNTLQEESPSVIFTAEDTQKLRETLEKDNRVSLVLEYETAPVSYAGGSMTAFVCEDFSRVTNDISYEGNNSANADEIAVGSALADKYGIGDTIEIKSGDRSAEYTVRGYVQSVNNSGAVCELTTDGLAKISEKPLAALNVYRNDETAEAFIEEYEKEHGKLISSSVNYERLSESGRQMYAGIVSAVTVVLLIISVLVVLLVMYVIINSLLTRRKQELGIYKAIGWSSGQLITQNAASFLPSIAAASVSSAVLGLAYLPAMNRAIFGLLGAYKNHFEIPLWFLLIFAVIFIAICYVISVLLARPIKRITAYSLLKE